MKKFLIAFLLVSGLALAQNVRYSTDFTSIVSKGNTPYVVANVPPNSPKLSVCSSPANGLPCTNYATTYTSSGAACPNGAQDTPDPQPSSCQATGDAQGNVGFWAPAGKYDYTVCVANNCFGPYTVTLGGSTSSVISSVFGRVGAITAQTGDYNVAQVTGAAPLASPAFTGTVDFSFLTGAVQCLSVDSAGFLFGTGLPCGSGGGGAVSSVFTRTGAVTAQTGDYDVTEITGAAPLASPTFTGTVAGIDATMVGLGSVTNDVQTQAAIVPNTPPAAGAVPIGNAGGTAYVPIALSGDASMDSSGVVTNAKINGIGVSGTPSTGYVPTATGSTAATWQAQKVLSVFGRTGAVVSAASDYDFSQLSGTLAASQVPTGGSATKFLYYDGTWQTPAGSGNVSNTGTPTNGQVGVWTAATTLSGVTPTGTGSPVFSTSPTFITGLSLSGVADGCAQFVSTVLSSTGSACGSGGGMVWPAGSGIPVVVSGASWGTTLSQSGTGSVAMTGSPTFTGTVSGITATMVGLGSVTNDAQTKAAIVPNTAPAAGKILVGNAGGTAYAPVSLSGDGTLTSAGVLTNTKLNGVAVPTSATVLGSNGSNQLVAATLQGNGSKVQLSTGTTTLNDCVKFDTNGNTADSGGPCSNLVASVFGRTGAVVATSGDYSVAQVTGAAPLASPTFTGTVAGITATMVGLGSVTNDVQTKASIVPNTAPSAGQILIGNAGGTAYAKNTLSGDSTLTSAGVITNVKINGAAIPASATVLGSNGSTQLVVPSLQGNGAKVQLSTGTTTTNALVAFDAAGNTVPSGITSPGGAYNAIRATPNLFSALPACTSGIEGTMAPVTDSTTNTWGATITGSGANHVLAYCNASNWTVAAK